MRFQIFLLLIILWLAPAPVSFSSSQALIVIGTTGGKDDAHFFEKVADQTQDALSHRGIKNDQIKMLSGRVTRANILAAFQEWSSRDKEDEFWLVLLGHGGMSQGDIPAFQVSGPRLTAKDLQGALGNISGQKFVFLGMERSGAFLPFLKLSDCTALAATAETGEINQPRFPAHWAEALAKAPHDSLAKIAARAAEATAKEYEDRGVVQGEHARLLENGKILEAPFETSEVADAAGDTSTPVGPPRLSASEIKIPKSLADSLFEAQPASDETRKILSEAQAAKDPDGHPALILLQERNFTIHSDGSTVDATKYRVFLARAESFEEWATYHFPQDAPRVFTEIEGARIILPDASALVLNPELLSASGKNENGASTMLDIIFPQAQPGSVVEISFRTERNPDLTLSAFYQEWELQHSIPALQTWVTLEVPRKQAFHYRLKNVTSKPVTSNTEHSKVLEWKFGLLPAFEPLPLDPPRRDLIAWLGVSSIGSWEEFATWYLRISKGSDEIGDGIKAKAKNLLQENPTRIARIKAAFEFVSSLRYVAIEFGIHGLRPRTPEAVLKQRYGDCKDKANLLIALLRAMKIPADFVILNRGSSTDPDFPGWQFNHAIAYLPEDKLWLDTTDSTTPFGTIAAGNLGRSALVFHQGQAAFKKISGTNTSSLREEWMFEEGSDGQLTGTFQEERGGLADDFMRQRVRSFSPLQREFYSARQLAALLPGADFSQLEISDPSDLKTPIKRKCTVIAGREFTPLAGLDFFENFALQTRDRLMELNMGHPLRYEQIVQIKFSTPQEKQAMQRDFHREAAGNTFTITSRQLDPQTWQRTATCDLAHPIISPSEYSSMRQTLRDWMHELSKPPYE